MGKNIQSCHIQTQVTINILWYYITKLLTIMIVEEVTKFDLNSYLDTCKCVSNMNAYADDRNVNIHS